MLILQVIRQQRSTECAPVIKVGLRGPFGQLMDDDLYAPDVEVVSHPDVGPCTVERNLCITDDASLCQEWIHFGAHHDILKAPCHHQRRHLGEHRFRQVGFKHIHQINSSVVPWRENFTFTIIDHEGQVVDQ